MKFYQVNQNSTFQREFEGRYLCSPDGSYWQLMRKLQRGDVLFHYKSSVGSVLGISRVTYIGHHKGAFSKTARVIPGTQCIQYTGRHLSEADFTAARQEDLRRKYSSYLEVHTTPIRAGDLGKVRPASRQTYLEPIDNTEGLRFLERNKIRLDDVA